MKDFSNGENSFRYFFESVRDCMFIFDKDGIIQDINQYGLLQLGYTKNDLTGKHIAEFVPPEAANEIPEQIAKLIVEGNILFESVILRKNGEKMPVEINAHLIILDGAEIIFAIHRDILMRKDIESMIAIRESKYRAVMETSKESVLLIDLEGKIVDANDVYVKLSGYSKEELKNMSFLELTIKGSRAERFAHMQQIIREGHASFESFHKTKDGKIWPVEVNASYWDIDNGLICEFIVDLSEVRQVLKHLEQTKQSMQKLLDDAAIGMTLAKVDGSFVYANEEACKLFGYLKSEMIKLHFKDLRHPDLLNSPKSSELDSLRRKVYFDNKKVNIAQVQCISKNSDTLWIRGTSSTYFDSTGDKFILTQFENSTDQKKLMEDLDQNKENPQKILDGSAIAMGLSRPGDAPGVATFVYANDVFYNMLGYQKNELENLTVKDILHLDEQSLLKNSERGEIEKELLEGAIDEKVEEARFVHKNGDTVWVRWSDSVHVDAAGEKRIVSQFENITGQIIFREKLEQNQESLKKVLDSIPRQKVS